MTSENFPVKSFVLGVTLAVFGCSADDGAAGGGAGTSGGTAGADTPGGGTPAGGATGNDGGGACDPNREPKLTLFLNYEGGAYTHAHRDLNGDGTVDADERRPADDVERRTFFIGEECQAVGETVFPPLTKSCRLDDLPPNPTELYWECDVGTCQGPVDQDGDYVFGRCSERDPAYEAAITAGVRQALAPYDIRVVDERPDPSIHYYTVLFTMNTACVDVYGGPVPDFAGNAAVQGCGILDNNEVFYASQATRWNWNWDFMVGTVVHEFGHTAGLVHYSPDNPDFDGEPPPGAMGAASSYLYYDDCEPHDGNTACREIQDQYCGSDAQNSHAVILNVFGPAPPEGVWHEPGVCGGSQTPAHRWPELLDWD